MTQAPVSFRFRAVSMGFAAYLDAPTLADVSLSFVRATPFSPFKSTSEKCATLVPGSRPGAGTTASRWERALRPSGRRASLEHQPIRRSKPIRVSFKTTIAVLGMALCVPLAACAPTRTRESTGAYIDDASITTKVKAAILADGGLKVFDIHVVTEKDVVLLSGFVDSWPMIGRASDVASRVAVVRGVRNDLIVR